MVNVAIVALFSTLFNEMIVVKSHNLIKSKRGFFVFFLLFLWVVVAFDCNEKYKNIFDNSFSRTNF